MNLLVSLITRQLMTRYQMRNIGGDSPLYPFSDKALPDEDPEGVARPVDEVFNRCGTDGVRNELVPLDQGHD